MGFKQASDAFIAHVESASEKKVQVPFRGTNPTSATRTVESFSWGLTGSVRVPLMHMLMLTWFVRVQANARQ